MSEPLPSPTAFRHVMQHFPTGVAVVTTEHEGVWHGMTVNSLAAVSLTPVLVLVCLSRESRTALAVHGRGCFAINLLRDDQEYLSHDFAQPGADHFSGMPVEVAPTGLPLLPDAVVHMVCDVVDVIVAGDHDIILGRLTWWRICGGSPLLFFLGDYHRLTAWCPR